MYSKSFETKATIILLFLIAISACLLLYSCLFYVQKTYFIGISSLSVGFISFSSAFPIENMLIFIISLILLFISITLLLIVIFQKKKNKTLYDLAFTDKLTGIANWNLFNIDCVKLLKKEQGKFAMVVADIDGFKAINDIYGGNRGDEILIRLARGIEYEIRSSELFCRSSSDNFTFLLKYKSEKELVKRITLIHDTVKTNQLSNFEFSLSFGIYIIEDLTIEPIQMRMRAELAKFTIKKSNQLYYAFYSESLRQTIIADKYIENNMISALKNEEFEVFYQPQYHLSNNSIAGLEALSRWRQADGTLKFPSAYINIFEKNGFILQLDMYMLRKVCRQLKKWSDSGISVVPVAVNFSRMHVFNPMFGTDLCRIVNEYDIPHELIGVEITESVFSENILRLLEVVKELRECGFKIIVDDFGSGYSSLNLISKIPVDILKIDRNFFGTEDIAVRGKMIILDIIKMAKHLGMNIIAEGVETKEQVLFLKGAGCEMVQGYYYSKPIDTQSVEKLLIEDMKKPIIENKEEDKHHTMQQY